jgi:hypothetical protein
MPTREECQKILSRVGFKLGVSPKLIATRLLSEDDKQDMLNGLLPIEALEIHVKVWKDMGMPDYANGHTEPMEKNFRYPVG